MLHCPENFFASVWRTPRRTAFLSAAKSERRRPAEEFLLLQERASMIAEALETGEFETAAELMVRCPA